MSRRRTLREWEELWRTKWDCNDYANLDAVFADTEAYQNVVCEVEIRMLTQDGRIDTVEISLLADLEGEDVWTVLANHEYTMFELGRVELEKEIIALLNLSPEEEEDNPHQK